MPINANFSLGYSSDELSLWQAAHVLEGLDASMANAWKLQAFEASGDPGRDVESLLESLRSEKVNAVVASAERVPLDLPDDIQIAATLPRGVVNDALVCHIHLGFKDLPAGAKVGISSARQSGQLLRLRDDVAIQNVNENIPENLAKIDAGELDAVLLPWVDLRRLGLAWRVDDIFGVTNILPYPGHGITAVLVRKGDEELVASVSSTGHSSTLRRLEAEREFAYAMGEVGNHGIAALASDYGQEGMRLVGRIVTPDGATMFEAERNILFGEEPKRLGEKVAGELRVKL